MASNICKVQKATDLCNEHRKKELILFCKTCKKQACTKCVEASHIGHEWDVLNVIANERKACLPKLSQDIKSQRLPSLKTLITGKDSDDDNDDILQQLEKKRISIMEATNTFIDEKKQRYKILKGNGSFQKYEIEEMFNYMDTITTSIAVNVHTYSDKDVLDMEQEMMSTLAKLESLKLEKEKVPALFIPGKLDHKVLNDMIGEVVSVDEEIRRTADITETHTISMFNSRIIAVQNDQAWVRDVEDNKIKLLENNGNIIQRMHYNCNDFVVMDNGDHVFTNKDGREVRMTSPDGNQRLVWDTKPLIPTVISKTCDGDLLISMRNEDDKYTITSSSRRLVQSINMTGEVIMAYEFQEDGKTRLFKVAGCTAGNMNGDVCSINEMSDEKGELVILHRDGRVRAIYIGRDDSALPFNPDDVTCDSRCRIIVSDFRNRSVHLMLYDGTFLRYYLSGLRECPECLSLYGSSLWLSLISDTSNKVKVYRYK